MRYGSRLLTLAAIVTVLGCGNDRSSGSELPTEGTLFEYTRSGGLAFSIYKVTIDADGAGTAEFGRDARDLDQEEFELSEAEIDELRAFLEEHPISSLPDPGEIVCADCFEYTYAYGGDEYTRSDASEPNEELSDLRALLADLPLPKDQANGG